MSFIKDKDAVLDYAWDWSDWLAEGETISTAVVTVPTGLTKSTAEAAADTGVVTVWVSGGTVGATYAIICHITTNQGRIDDRTMIIRVRER